MGAGAYAAPALGSALLTDRRPAFQARVAEVLGRLGPSLTPESRQEAKLVLRIAIARGKDEGFLLAALRALEALEPGAAAEEIRRLLAKVQRAAAGGAPATGPPGPAGRLPRPAKQRASAARGEPSAPPVPRRWRGPARTPPRTTAGSPMPPCGSPGLAGEIR